MSSVCRPLGGSLYGIDLECLGYVMFHKQGKPSLSCEIDVMFVWRGSSRKTIYSAWRRDEVGVHPTRSEQGERDVGSQLLCIHFSLLM